MELLNEKTIQYNLNDEDIGQIHKKRKKKKKQKDGPLVDLQSLPAFKRTEKNFRHYVNIKTDFSSLWRESILKEKSDLTNVNLGYKSYYLKWPEGIYIIKGFLSIPEQLHFARKILNDYHKKPNRTNIDSLKEVDNSLEIKDPNLYCFNERIRWANIGFQYDWTNRSYPEDKTNMPKELFELCNKTKDVFSSHIKDIDQYNPESVIINYYGEKDYMGGHLDDGEKDQDSPIFSYSIGLSCVFLIGGLTKQDEPIPVALESGDLIVMSGFSRKVFHGVPRIIENTFNSDSFRSYSKEENTTINTDKTFENTDKNIVNYLRNHRLNFNFRRVLPNYQ